MPSTAYETELYIPAKTASDDRGLLFNCRLFDLTSIAKLIKAAANELGNKTVTLEIILGADALMRKQNNPQMEAEPSHRLNYYVPSVDGKRISMNLLEVTLEDLIFSRELKINFILGLHTNEIEQLSSRFTLGFITDLPSASVDRLFLWSTHSHYFDLFRARITQGDSTLNSPSPEKLKIAVSKLALKKDADVTIVCDDANGAKAAVAAAQSDKRHQYNIVGVLPIVDDPDAAEKEMKDAGVNLIFRTWEEAANFFLDRNLLSGVEIDDDLEGLTP